MITNRRRSFRGFASFVFLVLAAARSGGAGCALVAISPPGAAGCGFFQRGRSEGSARHDWRSGSGAALPYLYGLGLCLVIAGLARPQAGKAESRISGEGIAIEIVLDISGSMEALDFQLEGQDVSRLTAVKHVIKEFVLGSRASGLSGRRDDLVGLVAFGGFRRQQVSLDARSRCARSISSRGSRLPSRCATARGG